MKKNTKPTEKVNEPPIVQLLPNGGFFINVTKDDGSTEKVKGRFDMMAIENFCEAKLIPGVIILGEFFRNGMKPSHYAQFIICAVHRTFADPGHCEYKEADALNWITAMGGFSGNEFMKLMAHGMKLFVRLSKDSTDMLQLTDEEKKILGIRTAGKI